MTRHVVPSRMVAHLWANQSQGSARNGKGSLFFDGPTIYSYRQSWPLARHFRGIVLINPNRHSVTTSAHASKAQQASSQFTQVRSISFGEADSCQSARDWKPDWKTDWAWFTSQLAGLEHKIARTKVNLDWLTRDYQRVVDEANTYARVMKLKRRMPALSMNLDEIRERCKAHDARVRELAQKRAAEERKEEEKRRAAWLSGDSGVHYHSKHLPVSMRAVDDELQTSLGARVPLAHAKLAFRQILRCKQDGVQWVRNGHSIRVGSFTIDRIEPNGDFKAGCHTILWSETERIARQLGLYPPPAQEVAA